METVGMETMFSRVLEEASQELNKARLELQRAVQRNNALVEQLRHSRLATVQALVQAMDVRDVPTNGHCQRVGRYVLATAKKLGVPDTKLEELRYAVFLHDIGKIGVPDAILNNPGPLTEEEWVQMRRHPELGYRLVQGLDFLDEAPSVVLYHHERFDGKGYPYGLKEQDIPLAARIFAVTDAYDAMTTTRPYRKALTPQAAIEEIVSCSGSQFDPLVVEAFLAAYREGFPQPSDSNGEYLSPSNHLPPGAGLVATGASHSAFRAA